MSKMTLADVMRMVIKPYPLSKKFREFLGAVPLDETASIQITGPPGSGKSTFILQIADEFARTSDVLYCTAEEKINAGGIKIRASKQGIRNKGRIHIAEVSEIDDIKSYIEFGAYRVVIIDSIQKVRQNGEKLRSSEVMQLTHAFPDRPTLFIYISQTNKRKEAAGDASDAHDVDVTIFTTGEGTEPRYARIDKSRLNPTVYQLHIFTPVKTGSAPKTRSTGDSPLTWPEIQALERQKRMKEFYDTGKVV